MFYNTFMAYPGVFLRYFSWHYIDALSDIFLVWSNFFWFIGHYFSMALLFRTFFSPWKRITEEYKREGIEEIAETFILNVSSRLVGMVVRFVILVVGLFTEMLLIVGLFIFYTLWLLLPFLVVCLPIIGVMFLF